MEKTSKRINQQQNDAAIVGEQGENFYAAIPTERVDFSRSDVAYKPRGRKDIRIINHLSYVHCYMNHQHGGSDLLSHQDTRGSTLNPINAFICQGITVRIYLCHLQESTFQAASGFISYGLPSLRLCAPRCLTTLSV
ncbi:predicted protein [Lichtheimia corymbifera JMRC:FSU:9682]|uniref:Uncharacterized protein n=1 Tax=Lichtheimia corymbifera JMRC:FSU:9682 TaxID=1263082 RepID=A0A068RN16_9FUNG|nr:predicted protein [Lichtheimia corymbifera JMRC:FSU:9682]